MIGLIDEREGIRFENYLLLSLYIREFNEIMNEDVRLLIVKNKHNLLLALSEIHPETFDCMCDSGVCRDELEMFLKNISSGN